MMRIGAGLVAAVLVSAAAPHPVLTVDGYGPIRIGMHERQVERFLEPLRPGQKEEPAAMEWANCHERATTFPGLSIMVENDRITRLALYGASRIKTDKGIGLGSSEVRVRAAYKKLSVETAPYLERPALEMIAWTVKDKKGVRFNTRENRRVESIYAGGASIKYIENCL